MARQVWSWRSRYWSSNTGGSWSDADLVVLEAWVLVLCQIQAGTGPVVREVYVRALVAKYKAGPDPVLIRSVVVEVEVLDLVLAPNKKYA